MKIKRLSNTNENQFKLIEEFKPGDLVENESGDLCLVGDRDNGVYGINMINGYNILNARRKVCKFEGKAEISNQ